MKQSNEIHAILNHTKVSITLSLGGRFSFYDFVKKNLDVLTIFLLLYSTVDPLRALTTPLWNENLKHLRDET